MKTYLEMSTKVLRDLKMSLESFIEADELVGYCNDGVRAAFAEIRRTHQDYFLKSAYLNLVTGTSNYALPTDIYAALIRGIIYHSGNLIYGVSRIRDWKKFADKETTDAYGSQMEYRYILQNTDPTTGMQIVLVPGSRETSGTVMRVWYIRKPVEVPLIAGGTLAATNAALVDIPEFHSYVEAFMKVKCLMNEGGPRLADAVAELQAQKELMLTTLGEMVPDNNDAIEMDVSHYWEHV